VQVVQQAVAGGVRFVLLRERDLDEPAFARLAEELEDQLPAGVVLSLHGRPGIAASMGAGLHLAENVPAPPAHGPWHGRSVHGAEAAARARFQGAAYLLGGTIFPTPGKPGAAPAGTAGLLAMCAAAGPVPVYAIGGLHAARVRDVRAAGAHGIAVVGAILEAEDPERAARALVQALQRALD
jgi:thiamine-phosphate pyrophosphorylase